MRILFVIPWGRALARVYCDELIRLGHEVALVTTGRHYEKQPARPYELLFSGTPKQPSSWPGLVRSLNAARRFAPDVIVTEEFNDPRLLVPLMGSTPVATLVHDDRPHDHLHERAFHHRVVYNRVADKADLRVTFSEYVAQAVRARGTGPVATVPLPSDAGEHLVPPFVPAEGRRDMVMIGRIGPYKNLPGAFEGWAEHVAGSGYRGDKLIVIGDGHFDGTLPPECEWQRGRFQFGDAMPVLAAAKASLAYYASASQSGVQVISMQCGTAAVVSATGGLAEYLPPGEQAVPLGRPDLLGAALDELADPQVAADRGQDGRQRYEQRHHVTPAAQALVDVLQRLRDGAFALTGSRRTSS